MAPKKHCVTLIPGDGIGPEIAEAVKAVLSAADVRIDWDEQQAGQAALEAGGSLLPKATLQSIRGNGVALKGPLTTPVGKGFQSLNVQLRQHFDLYANLRPVKSFKAVKSRFDNVDLVIVRENTEDLYTGIENELIPGVMQAIKIITAKASERIAQFAFRYATNLKRAKVTVIHKANIMKKTDGLFLDSARKIAKRYPKITCDDKIVDNTCMQLVMRPEQFDVLLTENLYGDILSDLAAGLVGGLGLAPGANLGQKVAIFEAVHGSAPDIAGKGVANPIALLLSACMMLDHLGELKAATRIREAVDKILGQSRVLTPDLKGQGTTASLTKALLAQLRDLS